MADRSETRWGLLLLISSTSRFDLLLVLRCISTHHGCKKGLFNLLVSANQSVHFSMTTHHFQVIFSHRTATWKPLLLHRSVLTLACDRCEEGVSKVTELTLFLHSDVLCECYSKLLNCSYMILCIAASAWLADYFIQKDNKVNKKSKKKSVFFLV